MIDSISREEEGVKSREEREVPEGRKVVVREINCILILRDVRIEVVVEKQSCRGKWGA